MTLQNRIMSPQSRIRQRKGFVTATRVPDCTEAKKTKAHSDWTIGPGKKFNRAPKVDEYENPKNAVFRVEKEIEPGMKDFELRIKPDDMENPHGLSAFD